MFFSLQLCWSQGTLVWNWTWTGTNDMADTGSGLLTTSLDLGGGVYQVLGASGNLDGYAVTGVLNYRSGFYPTQKMSFPLGTSGGTNFTQFIFALAQGCSEMIQVSQETVFPDPSHPGYFLTNYPTAVSRFQSGPGAYSPINQGIFSLTLEPIPPIIYGFSITNIQGSLITNEVFQFSFNVEPYHGYGVQSCDDLTKTNWVFMMTFDPPPFPTSATFYDNLTTSNRFYRVVTQ